MGVNGSVWQRPDGKPEVAEGRAVSAAHAGDLTLAVAGTPPISCDVELVVNRSTTMWRDLLGAEGFTLAGVVGREAEEDHSAAATRVWAAKECLKKAGAMVDTPLVLRSTTTDGWILLKGGLLNIATLVTPVRGSEGRLALAVLVRSNDASL